MKYISLVFYLLICLNLFSQKGSKEKIYSSFTIINDNLESTREILTKQISKQYFNLIIDKEKDSSIVSLADSLRIKSNDLINYLSRIKVFLIIKTEQLEKEVVVKHDTIIKLKYLEHFDDYFTPTELLIGESRWNPKKGKYTASEIYNKISDYSDFVQNTCSITHKKEFDYLKRYWNSDNFYHKPLAGIITQLSLIQLKVRLAEQATINSFYTK